MGHLNFRPNALLILIILAFRTHPSDCVGLNGTCDHLGSFPSPDSCSHYQICGEGQSIIVSCPQGQYFSRSKLNCTSFLDEYAESCLRGSPERMETRNYIWSSRNLYREQCDNFGESNDRAFPDPFQCNLYVICGPTYVLIEECAAGKLFDLLRGECQDADEVFCEERSRDPQIFGEEPAGRKRVLSERSVRKPHRTRKIIPKLRPRPGLYLMRKEIQENRYHPPTRVPAFQKFLPPVRTAPRPKPKTRPTTTESPAAPSGRGIPGKKKAFSGRKGGRGIFGVKRGKEESENPSDLPQKANVSDIIKKFMDSEDSNSTHSGPRRKRRIKTKIRKTETEFFDERGNFTNTTESSGFGRIRPKMRVKLVETETVYDESDEVRERKARKGKTPDQIVTRLEQRLDMLTAMTTKRPQFRGKGRSLAMKSKQIRKLKRPKKTDPLLLRPPQNYQEYEAPPGIEYDFGTDFETDNF